MVAVGDGGILMFMVGKSTKKKHWSTTHYKTITVPASELRISGTVVRFPCVMCLASHRLSEMKSAGGKTASCGESGVNVQVI
jgi:hypothetical protein